LCLDIKYDYVGADLKYLAHIPFAPGCWVTKAAKVSVRCPQDQDLAIKSAFILYWMTGYDADRPA
jgi:hypothetical protein